MKAARAAGAIVAAIDDEAVTRSCRFGVSDDCAFVTKLLRPARMIGAMPFGSHEMTQPPSESIVDDRQAPSRPLKIAIVTESWPPEINGVSTTIARVVAGLRTRGHGIQLVRPRQRADRAERAGNATGNEGRADEVLTRGMPIPRYPNLTMGLPSRRTLLAQWRLRRPDLVHIATEGPLGWSALRAARDLGLPLSSDFRTNFHAYCRHYGAAWLERPIVGYLRRFHNRTHATMVPTVALRDELAGLAFDNLHVVGRGVDTARFDPRRRSEALREAWAVGASDLVVACVGRLAPEKNLDVAVRAFDAIRRQRPEARLLFVGDGPQRAELQSRCERAIFAGMRSGDDLAAHYASADLLLFPSLTETFGNVTTEALASGLPLVAFDLAAAAQLVRSGDNGLLAPAGNERAFVDHALRVAASPTFARHLGARARASVLAHGWDAIVCQVETVMAEAMRRAASDPPALHWPAVQSAAG